MMCPTFDCCRYIEPGISDKISQYECNGNAVSEPEHNIILTRYARASVVISLKLC